MKLALAFALTAVVVIAAIGTIIHNRMLEVEEQKQRQRMKRAIRAFKDISKELNDES